MIRNSSVCVYTGKRVRHAPSGHHWGSGLRRWHGCTQIWRFHRSDVHKATSPTTYTARQSLFSSFSCLKRSIWMSFVVIMAVNKYWKVCKRRTNADSSCFVISNLASFFAAWLSLWIFTVFQKYNKTIEPLMYNIESVVSSVVSSTRWKIMPSLLSSHSIPVVISSGRTRRALEYTSFPRWGMRMRRATLPPRDYVYTLFLSIVASLTLRRGPAIWRLCARGSCPCGSSRTMERVCTLARWLGGRHTYFMWMVIGMLISCLKPVSRSPGAGGPFETKRRGISAIRFGNNESIIAAVPQPSAVAYAPRSDKILSWMLTRMMKMSHDAPKMVSLLVRFF